MTKTELIKGIFELGEELEKDHGIGSIEIIDEMENLVDYYSKSYQNKINTELVNALQTYLNAGSKEQRKEASVIAKKALSKALN